MIERGMDKQGILNYFGFEGTHLPNETMMAPDGSIATGKTMPNGNIGYSDLAFDSYDKLKYTHFKENFHSQRLLKDGWESWDYPRGAGLGYTKYYPEEAAGFLVSYKNQGLFPNNPMNYMSQINTYRAVYTNNFYSPKWWHFSYRLPGRY
jgi:hypothetical protein